MKKTGERILFILLVTGALVLWCTHYVFANLDTAQVQFLKGDYSAAVKSCDDFAETAKSADLPAAYYLKGRTLLKANRLDEAQNTFTKILTDFSKSAYVEQAQLGLADTLFAKEDYQNAVGEYRKFEEKYNQSPFLATVLYKLGKSHLKTKQLDQARFYFQKLQQDYPLSFESKLVDELDNSEFTYNIQVGCFSNYANAEKLVKRLKSRSFDAFISEKEGFPVFYRVRVGKFRSESDAKACKLSLEKNGFKTRLCP